MLQAMLKHAVELPPVWVVRTTYGEHEQIMRGPVAEVGAVTGLILDGKICRWPKLSGSGGLPIAVASDETT